MYKKTSPEIAGDEFCWGLLTATDCIVNNIINMTKDVLLIIALTVCIVLR